MKSAWPDSIAGTADDQARAKDLVIKYARDANKASLFNYASMAHNNHFMFTTLVRPPLFSTPLSTKSARN